ncbi:4'-phosphopantetheinyl transferase superfamily protein [Streptomyces sp. NPDC041068]|uniref:4'-phosphopantetheinyl transferase family protein n=1 Tax=Streptomyces sp. NPDC041068 TaxID=3155130 RepID=UPI00340B2375
MTRTPPEPLQAAPGIHVATQTGDPEPGLLTAHDRAGAARLPAWRARHRLLGRSALRRVLAARFPEAAAADVVHGHHGRPELAGWPRIGISVSHDQDTGAACAAWGHAVGVDVQYPPDRLSDSLLRRCLGEHAAVLDPMARRSRATEFAWVWTVQESCVKAAGTGLSGRPWAIGVRPFTRRGTWDGYRWVSLREQSPVPLSCAFAELPAAPTPQEAP